MSLKNGREERRRVLVGLLVFVQTLILKTIPRANLPATDTTIYRSGLGPDHRPLYYKKGEAGLLLSRNY